MADILTIGSSKYNVKLRRTGSNFTIDVGDEISEGHFLRKSDGRLEIILNGKGIHFDPKVVDAFLAQVDSIKSVKNRLQNQG